MVRSARIILASLFVISGLMGCSDDTDDSSSSSSGGNSSKTDDKKTDDKTGDDKAGDIGPKCTAYLACCDELVAEQPAMAGACDSTKTSLANAKDNATSADSLESACEQALQAAQGAGHCK